jgi:hypothetical protein
LGAILRLAKGARNAKRPGDVAEAFVAQIKLDGARRHPGGVGAVRMALAGAGIPIRPAGLCPAALARPAGGRQKIHEIIAIPPLLERLHLTGALVTIDAMGCQTRIAPR